jgi:pimeloyl-ACP methyl ester carboxylesterase
MAGDGMAPTRRSVMAAGIAGAVLAGGARRAAAADAEGAVDSAEYWAKRGDVALYMFRKWRDGGRSDGKPMPVLFLVHGSSLSGRSTFDLTVPGAGEYSMMNVFARLGYDVWTMDFAGYGRSSAAPGNSDVASGVADLKAASEVVAQATGRQKFHFLGESSGALRAAAFAVARPDRVDRLALESFVWTGKGSPTLAKRAQDAAYFQTHDRRTRDRAMIRSIFTRDKPGTSDPRVAEALADVELKFGDTVPTGTYLDMVAHLPLVDPAKLEAPVLMLRGQYDGIASLDDVLAFFARLPNPDRQFTLLAGAAHAIGLGLNRAQLWHALHAFLDMPPRADV